MKREVLVLLLIFVLVVGFIYWYFLSDISCKPFTQCNIPSTNKTCTSDNDCSFGSTYGNCNLKTFRCVNLVFTGNKQDCLNMGGTWYEGGC
jgi:hypothetical protein